jgi:hypothetical protein
MQASRVISLALKQKIPSVLDIVETVKPRSVADNMERK